MPCPKTTPYGVVFGLYKAFGYRTIFIHVDIMKRYDIIFTVTSSRFSRKAERDTMKLIVTIVSGEAVSYLHEVATKEGLAIYKNGSDITLTGEDEHTLETLEEEIRAKLCEGLDYDIIYFE